MGVGWSCLGPSATAPREDWPESGPYALSMQKNEGAALLVAGIDPIYATRKQSRQYLGDGCSMSMGVALGSEQRLRLVAEMLGTTPKQIPWQVRPATTIEFQSLQQFDADLLAFVNQQQERKPWSSPLLIRPHVSSSLIVVLSNLLMPACEGAAAMRGRRSRRRGQLSPFRADFPLPPPS